MNEQNQTEADDFESGLDSRRTEKPHDKAVKKGLHVLTHFKPEPNLSKEAEAVSREFESVANKLTTIIQPGNILTSALERLLDSRNMAVQYMANHRR